MKKFLSLVLCFAIMTVSAFAATTFTDVKESDYFAEAAVSLAEKGILKGYNNGSFGAEKSIKRSEAAAIICRMLGKDAEAVALGGATSFTDVEATNWASGYVNYASKEGIVNGYGTEFKPDNNIKLEEMVKMVVCALNLEAEVKADPTDWSKGYMDIAESKGILSDVAGIKGTFVTRGDVAVMVNNGLNMEAEEAEKEKVEAPTTPTVPDTPSETVEEYTVTFIRDVETSDEYLSVTVKEGDSVEQPDDPTKEGYKFDNWYADEVGNRVFDFMQPITDDTTVYAQWTQDEVLDDDLFSEEIIIYDEDGNPIIED